MPPLFALLAKDVKNYLAENFSKLKTQSDGYNYRNQVEKSFNFCYIEEKIPFRLRFLFRA